jgi:hypothetical protein
MRKRRSPPYHAPSIFAWLFLGMLGWIKGGWFAGLGMLVIYPLGWLVYLLLFWRHMRPPKKPSWP